MIIVHVLCTCACGFGYLMALQKFWNLIVVVVIAVCPW